MTIFVPINSASESDFKVVHQSDEGDDDDDDTTDSSASEPAEAASPHRQRVRHVQRGNCEFWGVVCNEKLDRFGEIVPECGVKCDNDGLVEIDNGFNQSTAILPNLCAPMGHRAASMATEIAQFRQSSGKEHLKMYLATNDAPPFCKN